jgi:hypothetical protein
MVFVRDSRYRYVLSLAATTTKPKNSGQVYKAAPQLTVLPEKWYNSSTGSDRDFRQFKNADGVASLSDMALRSFIRNRQELDADTLEYVDWNPVGKRLWEVIMKK